MQIHSTMAGIILRILVAPGDQVESGQEVIVLESMKMEVPITAENSGTVKEIKVATGDFVGEHDILMELE